MMKKILYAFLTLIIVLAILIFFFGYTTTGLRTLFNLASTHFNDGLKARQIEGHLLGQMKFEGLRFHYGDNRVFIKHIDVNWRPITLASWRIYITHLTMDHAIIHLANTQPEETKTPQKPFKLPIAFSLHNIDIKHMILDQDGQTTKIQSLLLDTYSFYHTIHIKTFDLKSLPYELKFDGKAQIRPPYNINLQGKFSNSVRFYDPIQGQFSIQGNLENKLTSTLSTKPPQALELHAEIDHGLDLGKISVEGHYKQFIWPLSETDFVNLTNGNLNISGTLKNYIFKLSTQLMTNHIPHSTWNISGHGSDSQLTVQELSSQLLDGKLLGNAVVRWQNGFSWQASLTAQALNLHKEWKIPKSHVNFLLTAQGEANQQNQQTTNLQLSKLYGIIGSQRLSGNAQINMDPSTTTIKNLHFALGQNIVNISGKLSKHSQLNWKITLPDMNQFSSLFHGSIVTQGSLAGNYDAPQLAGSFTANRAVTPWISMNLLKAQFNIDTTFNQNSSVQLSGNGINYKNYHFETIEGNISGNRQLHQANLTIQGPHGKLYLISSGGKKKEKNTEVTTENVSRLDLVSPSLGNWQLNHPIHFLMTQDKMTISSFCWRSPKSSICANGNWYRRKPWLLNASISHLNLALFRVFLPPTVSITSDLNVNLHAQGFRDRRVHGKLSINLNSALLRYQTTHHNKSLALGPSNFNLTIDKNGLTSALSINTADKLFPITANFSMPNYYGRDLPDDDQIINGNLSANWHSLQPLAKTIPMIDVINGQVSANIKAGGTFGNPNINGLIELLNTNITTKDYGLKLRNINLRAQARNNNITLNGQASSGKGSLTLSGQTTTQDLLSKSRLKISGNNFQIINTHEYDISVTPDLTLNYDEPRLTITGTLLIPTAKLTPQDFTSTVTLPDSFAVIRSAEKTEIQSNLQTFMKINLDLGKDFSLKYSGITTKIAGKITVSNAPESTMMAVGQFYTENGKFQAYGTSLTIEKGELTFTGGPIDNPALNIIALKRIPVYDFAGQSSLNAIYAGVQVTGNADNPKVSLYSRPSLPDSDIMSYLLFGKSSSNLSSSNAAVMGQALGMLANAEGGGNVLSGVQSKLGLTQFGIESSDVYLPGEQGAQSNTSFVVGKRINKRLEVLYSVGFAIPVNILMLRYQLWKRLMLQTNWSNYENSGDIFYTF